MPHCKYCNAVVFTEEEPYMMIPMTEDLYHIVGGAASCYNLALMDALLAKRKEREESK